jgi:hypothetical protein
MDAKTQVFVQSTGVLAGGATADPSTLADGLIAIYNEGPLGTLGEINVADGGNPVIGDYQNIRIARGMPSGNAFVTSGIRVSDILYMEQQDYRAPVKQVTTLSTLPAVPAAGGTYTFRVQNLGSQSETPNRWHTYTKEYEAGETLVIADLLALVNDKADSVVVATTGGADVVLTAKEFDQAFDVATDDLLTPGQGVTETATTAIVYGIGTPAQILALEKEVAGTFGEYTVPSNLLGPRAKDTFSYPPRTTVPTTALQYDTFTLRVKIDNDDSINRGFQYQEIIFFIEDSGVTQLSDWLDFWATVLRNFS